MIASGAVGPGRRRRHSSPGRSRRVSFARRRSSSTPRSSSIGSSAFFLLLLHARLADDLLVRARRTPRSSGTTTRSRAVLPLTAVFVFSMQAVAARRRASPASCCSGKRCRCRRSCSSWPTARRNRAGRRCSTWRSRSSAPARSWSAAASSAEGRCSRRSTRWPRRVGLLSPGASTLATALVLFAFASKAGLAPFHAWLPEAHPRAPSHVSALMSGVDAEGGDLRPPAVHGGVLAGPARPRGASASWRSGSAGAAVAVIYANIAREIKRVLAWSSVENIGLAFGMFGFQVLLRRRGLAGARRRGDGRDVPAPARARAVQVGTVPRGRRDHARGAHREDRNARRPGGRMPRLSAARAGALPRGGRAARRSGRSWPSGCSCRRRSPSLSTRRRRRRSSPASPC